MVRRSMMFCKLIFQISVTGPPVHFELFLSDEFTL